MHHSLTSPCLVRHGVPLQNIPQRAIDLYFSEEYYPRFDSHRSIYGQVHECRRAVEVEEKRAREEKARKAEELRMKRKQDESRRKV